VGLENRDGKKILKAINMGVKRFIEERCNYINFENFRFANFLIDNTNELKSTSPSKKFVSKLLKKSSQINFIYFIEWAIKNGADIDVKDSRNCTSLYYAAKNRQFESVKFLVEKGADVNSKNFEDNTPLMAVVPRKDRDRSHRSTNWFEIALYLIDRGANINTQTTGTQQIPSISFFDLVIQSPSFMMQLIDKVKHINLSDSHISYILRNGTFKLITKLLEIGISTMRLRVNLLAIMNSAYPIKMDRCIKIENIIDKF